MVVLEESVHRSAIREIADGFGRPVAEVADLYQETFATLEASATVTTYLPVLVARKIRERYRNVST